MRSALVFSFLVHAAVGGALWFRAIEPPAPARAPARLALRPVAAPPALDAPRPRPPDVLPPPVAPAEETAAPPVPAPEPEPDWVAPEAVAAPSVRQPLRFQRLARPLPRRTPPPAPAAPAEAAPAVAAPRPAAAKPAPAGSVAPPRLDRARSPRPPYPLRARRRGLEGEVVILAHVTARGTVASASIETSSGHPVLDRAALDAVRRYRYAPARRGGRPVAYDVRVPVLFRLE